MTVNLEMMGMTLEEYYASGELTLPQRALLDQLRGADPIRRGTVEETLYAALEVAGPPV